MLELHYSALKCSLIALSEPNTLLADLKRLVIEGCFVSLGAVVPGKPNTLITSLKRLVVEGCFGLPGAIGG